MNFKKKDRDIGTDTEKCKDKDTDTNTDMDMDTDKVPTKQPTDSVTGFSTTSTFSARDNVVIRSDTAGSNLDV